jgi:hypothetical protein
VTKSIALELTQLRTRTALRSADGETYLAAFTRRVRSFLQTLWRAYPDVALELRLLVQPDDAAHPLRFLLLGGKVQPYRLLEEVRQLLHATFSEYEAELVQLDAEPLPKSADAVLLRRRWADPYEVTIQAQPPGFFADAAVPRPAPSVTTLLAHTLMRDEFGDNANSYIGPVFTQHVRTNLLLTISDPNLHVFCHDPVLSWPKFHSGLEPLARVGGTASLP